ncbi:MAG TPA: ATP-dependent Clp protease proteolytic subunit [Chloroflexota bacterium]|jgi:ATP-dependent Clp protease protease subunit|nr:ATP-dependent Clp protease proteolytic subunit [Chloroflexota bacterium]
MANQPRPAVPLVIAPTGQGERVMDVYSSLLQQRIIFLSGMVDDTVANVVIAQLLHLDQTDSRRDVQLLINSPGGVVDAGLAIYDTMRLIRPPVSTTCVGLAASIAAVLLAGGTRGKRTALPSARVMIHQALGGIQGTGADIDLQARELLRQNARIKSLLAADTGQPLARIAEDVNRDYWMGAEEARAYGLIDSVATPPAAEAPESPGATT